MACGIIMEFMDWIKAIYLFWKTMKIIKKLKELKELLGEDF